MQVVEEKKSITVYGTTRPNVTINIIQCGC